MIRAPRNYPVEQPTFGVYRVPEGWAIWAAFPEGAPRRTFLAWVAQQGILFDIERHPPEAPFHEYGAVVNEARAETYRAQWVRQPESV